MASPALANGNYTAIATEPSGLGNDEGKSSKREFEIDTEPPEVTLNSVTSPSNNTKPSFSGTASETLPGDRQDLQRLESRRLAGGNRGRACVERKMGCP